MKLSRLTPVMFIVWLVFYMFGNNMLPVTDPVESNYALTAKEMVLSGDWLSPQIYGTYWYDKPIMIYWLIALCFKLFGIADWVVRLPSAIFGALSVATMYQSMRTISGKWALGLIGASVLGTSLMFWTVAHGIITDMVLLYTTLMVMIYSYKGMVEQKPYAMIVAYVFAALGVLTKGPVALVLPGMILLVFAGINRSWFMVKAIFDWRGILAFCAVCFPWYAYMYSVHGQDFINGFLGLHNVTRATQSEHPEDNVWWYYLAIFLGASMPWTGAVIYGMTMALLPIAVFFLIFQFVSLKLRKLPFLRIMVGILYTYLGLVLFLTGVNVGFSPLGYALGAALAEGWKVYLLAPLAMLMGWFIINAEPAVHTLNKQVAELSAGAISERSMGLSLSVAVSAAGGLAMLRVITGISIMYFLVPGYLIAIALSFFVPRTFTAIAFDSGGVASGPLTATFMLPFATGACEALGGNVMTDAFGLVALVAMMPLITVQVMGAIYVVKSRHAAEEPALPDFGDNEIIELWEAC